MFARRMCDKGRLSKGYKEPLQLTSRKHDLIKRWTEPWPQTLEEVEGGLCSHCCWHTVCSGARGGWWVRLSSSWLDQPPSSCLELAGKAAGEGGEHPDDRAGVRGLEAEAGEAGNKVRGRWAPGFPRQVSLLLMWDDVEMPLGLPDTFLSSGSARKWRPEISPNFSPFLWGGVCPGPPVRGQLPLEPVTQQ